MKKIIARVISFFLIIVSSFTINIKTLNAEDITSFNVSWPNVNEYTYDATEKTYSPIIDVNHVEVAYIETDGKAYINTGMYASDKSGIEISYCFTRKLTTSNQSYHLFGNVSDGSAVVRSVMYFSHHLESYNGGYYISAYGKRTEPGNTGNPPFIKADTNDSLLILKASDQTATYNGTLLFQGSRSLDGIKSNLPLYILSGRSGTSETNKPCQYARLYYCKVTELNDSTGEDDVVRDFIPVIVTKDLPKEYNAANYTDPTDNGTLTGTATISNGTACLYDKITEKYYLNETADGSFVAGIKMGDYYYKVLSNDTDEGYVAVRQGNLGEIDVAQRDQGKLGKVQLSDKSFTEETISSPAYASSAYSVSDYDTTQKATNASENTVTITLNNLGKLLYNGTTANLSSTWKINKVNLIPIFSAYNGLYDKQEHPLQLKVLDFDDSETSAYSIKYNLDGSSTYDKTIDDINAEKENFKNLGKTIIYYELTPNDTTNYNIVHGSVTINIHNSSPSKYKVPETGIE